MAITPLAEQARTRDYAIDIRLFRRIYKLTRPYWVRPGAWGSWLALALTLSSIGINVGLGAWLSFVTRDMTNALVAKQGTEFWHHFLRLSAVTFGIAMAGIPISYLTSRLQLHWRAWLTTYLTERYLQRRAYYTIATDQSIDNPDQRIQEEVGPFCQTLSGIPSGLINSVAFISVQAGVLLTISAPLFWCTVGYSLLQFFLTIKLNQPTVKQNFDITLAEAELRYGLLHVRDHAEIVAFYRGEDAEQRNIRERLANLVRKVIVNIRYNAFISAVQQVLNTAWSLVPYALLVPVYFTGHMDYGTITQAQMTAAQILFAFAAFTAFIPTVAQLAPHAVRLAQIDEKFEALDDAHRAESPGDRIALRLGDGVELHHVSLRTPGGELPLVRDISLSLAPGAALLIVGQTGVGKSSLLRAMAGLWTNGSGQITMPAPEQCLFLPQKPYMTLSDLRSQLLYPAPASSFTDQELQAILERVQLPDLAEQHGGFDTVQDWSRTLSLGEQQRIAFARVLCTRPRFVFLDEATSAVDIQTETLLYGVLRRSGATIVSVGHRPSLLTCHTDVLTLLPGGSWSLEAAPGRGAASDDAVSPAIAPTLGTAS